MRLHRDELQAASTRHSVLSMWPQTVAIHGLTDRRDLCGPACLHAQRADELARRVQQLTIANIHLTAGQLGGFAPWDDE